jgi:hypothetical protein
MDAFLNALCASVVSAVCGSPDGRCLEPTSRDMPWILSKREERLKKQSHILMITVELGAYRRVDLSSSGS